MKKALRRFFNRYFVEVRFLQSILVIPYQFEGKKYLHISQIGKEGRVIRRTFLIEHLVDDNLAVTDQTLAEEKNVFKNPSLF